MTLRALLFLTPFVMQAALVRVEVSERSPILAGKSFGQAGAYERIIGKAHFAVDPMAAANRDVVNLKLAPRNAKGQVEFYADFVVFAPVNPKKSNGTLFFEVSNRGRKGLLHAFSLGQGSNDPRTAAEFGDALLLNQGFTLAWLGWQFDVPREPPLMSVTVPVAKKPDGSPIQGVVRSDFVPDQALTSFSLGDRLFFPYRVADPNDASATLTERSLANGPRRVIPRSDWSFTEDRGAVQKASGFESGKIYEVVYRSQDPPVTGLGMAGIRDFISALKAGTAPAPLAALAPAARRSLAYGSSQSGRFLRTFLYQGFNRDEQGRRVFDGVWANVAGAGRGNFNHQFAQPSRDARPFFNFYYATDIFPFTDLKQSDPVTGLEGGILVRAEQDHVVPKIFYTNSAYEYYGRAASLMHTTLDGSADVPLAANTRLYVMAGGNHGPGSIPPARSANTRYLSNGNDYQWLMRGLLVAMQRWLAEDAAPPPSIYPRVDRNELAKIDRIRFPKLAGVAAPKRLHEVFRLDFGPDFRSRGIVTIEPPKMGPPFTILVPQVDADGNDIGGLKTPQVAVPLAAHTGWNLRNPAIGSPEELFSMTGSYFPFPREAAIQRYGDRTAYLSKVRAAAQKLIDGRYLLESDLPSLEKVSSKEWDFVVTQPAAH
ncbi:MAG TPA: alpha/beta hydrolase domain-containing protein [Bryobacteraceae bacterium]|nr:alpha/beta hydrolase domain-containing protein [Bryobacteraceae bacterium]